MFTKIYVKYFFLHLLSHIVGPLMVLVGLPMGLFLAFDQIDKLNKDRYGQGSNENVISN